ncbi:unnamed protein product [Prorocentrum cordatum]|uniref:Uncharacterized protein n=1 Tax=Prorocentrum cordatum TaxID=2364126 RepID=A0ABN9VCR3_9DINO|nr:unnamed protein product [Polarella glacialis]
MLDQAFKFEGVDPGQQARRWWTDSAPEFGAASRATRTQRPLAQFTSVPHRPQSKGIIARSNRRMTESANAAIFAASADATWWVCAVVFWVAMRSVLAALQSSAGKFTPEMTPHCLVFIGIGPACADAGQGDRSKKEIMRGRVCGSFGNKHDECSAEEQDMKFRVVFQGSNIRQMVLLIRALCGHPESGALGGALLTKALTARWWHAIPQWLGIWRRSGLFILVVYVDDATSCSAPVNPKVQWKSLDDAIEFKEKPAPISRFIGARYRLTPRDAGNPFAGRAMDVDMSSYARGMVKSFGNSRPLSRGSALQAPIASAMAESETAETAGAKPERPGTAQPRRQTAPMRRSPSAAGRQSPGLRAAQFGGSRLCGGLGAGPRLLERKISADELLAKGPVGGRGGPQELRHKRILATKDRLLDASFFAEAEPEDARRGGARGTLPTPRQRR